MTEVLQQMPSGRVSLWAALRPSMPGLAVGTLTSGLAGLAKLGALWFLVQLIDRPATESIVYAGLLLFSGACLSSISSWLCHQGEAGVASRLRRFVARHLARLPASTLGRWDDRKIRGVLSDDVVALHHLVAHLPGEITTFALVPLVSVVLLLLSVGPAGLIVLIPGVLASLYYLWLMPKVSARFGEERIRLMSEIVTAVDEYVRGIRVNRLYGAESGALASYRQASIGFTQGIVVWVKKVATAAAVAAALMQAVTTFTLAYLVTQEQEASVTAAAMLFGLAIVTPALKLGHGLDYVRDGIKAIQRLEDFFTEPVLPEGQRQVNGKSLALEVEDLRIAVSGAPVIEGANYHFAPGTLSIISGASGSGKTTLLRAMAGLEVITDGSIRIAGIGMSDLNDESRQATIRLLPQNCSVLEASVRENLRLGTSVSLTDESLLQALAQVGLDASLEDCATLLSGGEKQKLGLARLLISEAPILLFDEPTSALDDESALRVMEALSMLAREGNRTLVLVSHDADALVFADQHIRLSSMIKELE